MEEIRGAKIFVAGHRGMVGAAIVRELRRRGYTNIVTRTRRELDLTSQQAVSSFFEAERPAQVVLAAARVGGIHANNTFPADFIYENLMIEANVIHSSFIVGVAKLLFLGSSCIYPRNASQPMAEPALLTGTLESTNEPYAIAKIAGIKLCESYNRQHDTDFRSVMPTNLYGPGDNFHPENSHVIPALMRRFHEAKSNGEAKVTVWGSGRPRREFLFVDDMAEASVHVLEMDTSAYEDNTEPMLSHINVGTGRDVTIAQLAETIAAVTCFQGEIEYDSSRPDGTERKLMDVSRLASMGWKSSTSLRDGLAQTYRWFLEQSSLRAA
ncbi:MAG: GDP-L-fucose synthase [Verrucomicrobiota bacterium]